MAANTIIQEVYKQVVRRNAGEVEFLQAVKEVLDSLGPVLDKHPEYVEDLEFFPLRARYIRIFASDGDDRFSISEFQVFGHRPSP